MSLRLNANFPTRSRRLSAVSVAPLILATGLSAQAQEPESRPPVDETVTVTATRQPFDAADLAAPATLVTGSTLRARPATGLDEALRWQPGFSLLRRTPARAAHPTTQGLNLRGVAPSGTSRALVMVDGLPLTDAFGGWVYWSRVPSIAIDAVEIVPGGASSTYGNQSLAGTAQIRTRSAAPGLQAVAAGVAGSLETWRGSALVGGGSETARGLVVAEHFETGGYVATAPAEAGPVDTEVATRHTTARGTVDVGGLRLSADVLREDRDNGTPEQHNSTRAWGANGTWSLNADDAGLEAVAAYRNQDFRSRFSSVATDRNSERPVLDQLVESSEVVLGARGWRSLNEGLTLGGGLDWRRVEGVSFERVLAIDLEREPGGAQSIAGGYGALTWRSGNAIVEGALRGDTWRNTDRGDNTHRSLSEWSPRLGVAWHAGAGWTVRLAAYRSFRAPTLNELYRQFRVGNVITRANADLAQERLRGIEGGAEYRGKAGDATIRARVHGYANRLDDAVINATTGATPTLLFRQRDNLGRATVRGLEVDFSAAWNTFTLAAAGTWIDAAIDADVPGATVSVVGNRLPQVPDYRARVSAQWIAGRWGANLAVQLIGEQYEDERNERRLAPATTVDVGLSLVASDAVDLSIIAQNLLDEDVQVARTPVLALGPPRTVLARLEWALQ